MLNKGDGLFPYKQSEPASLFEKKNLTGGKNSTRLKFRSEGEASEEESRGLAIELGRGIANANTRITRA